MKRQHLRDEPPERLPPPEVTDLTGLEFIRSEVNLLVFPFFALTTKGLRRKLESEFRALVERDGQRVELIWNVSANPKYGYPGLFDRQVHRAIEQIVTEMLQETGQVENPIPLGSLYSLCERMGLTRQAGRQEYGGRQYQAIRQALERIATASIKSEGSFYHKGEQRWTSQVFHLYDAVIFHGKRLRDGTVADTNYLYLSDTYLQSINAFYVKPLDYLYQRSLRSPIASRLYEILSVKFYGMRDRSQSHVCFKYSTLTQLLPVEQYPYLAHAKKQLNPAHEELLGTDFLAAYEWGRARNDGEWLLYYRPGKRAKDEIRRARAERQLARDSCETLPGADADKTWNDEAPPESDALTPAQQELLDQLVGLNVSEATARGLVESRDPQTIGTWTEAIRYVQAQDKAAFLVKAIQENWEPPEEYLRAKEEEKRQTDLREAELARQRKEQRREQRRESEARKLDRLYENLTPAQQDAVDREIAPRLPPFLQEQFRRQTSEEEPSSASAVILRHSRREVLREWLKQGKLRDS